MAIANSVTDIAVRQALKSRLIEETADDKQTEILGYVNLSAIITHELGNRRYGSYVFLIRDGVVMAVNAMEPHPCPQCKGIRKQEQFEPCEYCDGDGCARCYLLGGTKTTIPCQYCKEIDNAG